MLVVLVCCSSRTHCATSGTGAAPAVVLSCTRSSSARRLSESRKTCASAALQSQLLTGSGLKRPPQSSCPAEMSACWSLAGSSEDTTEPWPSGFWYK